MADFEFTIEDEVVDFVDSKLLAPLKREHVPISREARLLTMLAIQSQFSDELLREESRRTSNRRLLERIEALLPSDTLAEYYDDKYDGEPLHFNRAFHLLDDLGNAVLKFPWTPSAPPSAPD